MLSILIPVYNYDVRSFVLELTRQAMATGVSWEIRCYDDGSAGNFRNANRELEQLEGVIYRELPENIGRSAIRNLLARDAAYPYLLFLDCDSFPEYPDFVGRYTTALQPGTLLYGGRSYSPEAPGDPAFQLRWKYGSAREVFRVEQRTALPWQCFQTNNFVVPKSVFLEHPLNETLQGYGHEDTLFGLELMQHNIPVVHLDNPLRHLGLEPAAVFLEKTREGVANLVRLMGTGTDTGSIRLAHTYRTIRKCGLAPIFRHWYCIRKDHLRKNLLSAAPSLRAFDLYKLGELCVMAHQRKGR